MNEPSFDLLRLDELLADRALFGLTETERDELDLLLAGSSIDADAYDRIAAVTALALNPGPYEPLPEHLQSRISKGISALIDPSRPVSEPQIRPASSLRREVLAWLVTAASLLVLAFAWSNPARTPVPVSSTLAETRQDLLSQSADVVQVIWTATPDPGALNVTGDVVWSNSKQRGFMRFAGLAKNDQAKSQYQLWIFDANQDARYPIDGGVFDVDTETGDVIVPIQAKIRVMDPTMFAITVEKPGGVVVSDRQQLLLIAKPTPNRA